MVVAEGPTDSKQGAHGDRGIPAVEVRGLVKRYGERAVVDGVTFEIQPGEVFALLGPNGAGKTTTVEILEGYRKADGGEARVLGLDPRKDGDRLRRRIGLMLQQGGIYPQLTCIEALRLFAAFYPDPEDPERMLDRMQLRDAARVRFRHLSGGQKQRLSLGLALIGQPELVFLDEPTAAMDPQARHATWEIVRSLRQQGVTVLLTTHFMDEADQLADRVAIVDRGRLVALDTPAGLRRAVGKELRFQAAVPLEPAEVARAIGLPEATVELDADGSVLVHADPTPALVASLSAWLADRDILLTELRAGTRSLEQAFLALTASNGDGEVR